MLNTQLIASSVQRKWAQVYPKFRVGQIMNFEKLCLSFNRRYGTTIFNFGVGTLYSFEYKSLTWSRIWKHNHENGTKNHRKGLEMGQ